MRRFQNFIKRLINAKNSESSSQERDCPVQFGCTSTKDTQTPENVSHYRSRSHCVRHSTNRTTNPHRCTAQSGQSFQWNGDPCEAPLRTTSPTARSDGASGARRAPNLATVQPSRSPRPPFEESVRSVITRRTPGSEDATSVETEIGYPVVGPATSRGHTTVTNTLFHQDVIAYSQDVSTNTSQTENFRVFNPPQPQENSGGSPAEESLRAEVVSTPVEVNADRVSTECQTNLVSVPVVPVLEHHVPTLSRVESATTNEEQQHGAPLTISEQPSLENPSGPAMRAPTIGTETSPFRPVPKSTETSSRLNPESNSGPSQSSTIPTNYFYPSQMRRNRSNMGHGNGSGHRKTAANYDEELDMECETNTWSSSKLSRANLTSESVHHDTVAVELCCSQIAEEKSAGTPVEIMVHSLNCTGQCQIECCMKDCPHTSSLNDTSLSISTEASTIKCVRVASLSKAATTFPPEENDSEKLALNVMSCISWSDLPNNLAVTDRQGKAVQNVRILIIPSNFHDSSYLLNGLPSDQQRSTQTRLRNIKRSDGLPGDVYEEDSSSDAAQQNVHVSSPRHLTSAIAVQVSFPVTSKPEDNTHMVDCSTQSILRDTSPVEDNQLGAMALTPPLPLDEVNQNKSSSHDFCSAYVPLQKHHSVCISVDNSRKSINYQEQAPHAHYSRKNVADLYAHVQLINQACGPDYPFEITSTGVGISMCDLHDCSDEPIYGKYEHCFVNTESAETPLIYEYNSKEASNQVCEADNLFSCKAPIEIKPLSKPLLVITVPEKGSHASVSAHESLEPIDIKHHLFVKKTSAVSVASSVYIGDDGKAVATGSQIPRLSDLSVSEAPKSQQGRCVQSTGAIPKRELGARPKVRGETLSVRKKMHRINDRPARHMSSGMDDIPSLGPRGNKAINDRNRCRAKVPFSPRKNPTVIRELLCSPGLWLRKTASKRPFECARRRCSKHHFNEVMSIWINPETEQSSPSSNSTIDITLDLNQTSTLSDKPKSPCSSQLTDSLEPKRPPDPVSRSTERLTDRGGVWAKPVFQCVMCKCYVQPVTTQCIEGHRLCAKCFVQHVECPVCNSAIVSKTNKAIDVPLQTFPLLPKVNQPECRNTIRIDNTKLFESRCLHRPQTCPLANHSKFHCTWKGVRSGIRPHMKRCHGHTGTVYPFRTLFMVEAFDLRLWENRTYDVEVLFVETEIFELHKVYDFRKSCLWGLLRNVLAKDVSLRYTYNIRFQPQDIRGTLTFNTEVIGGAEELDEAFKNGKRFKFHLDSFSQEPIQFFNIHLKVIPKAALMIHSV